MSCTSQPVECAVAGKDRKGWRNKTMNAVIDALRGKF